MLLPQAMLSEKFDSLHSRQRPAAAYKFGHAVGNVCNTGVSEKAVDMLQATVEETVGLVIVESALLIGIATYGLPQFVEFGTLHTLVLKDVAAAHHIAKGHRGKEAQLLDRFRPKNFGRHARVPPEAKKIAHHKRIGRLGIEVDTAETVLAVEHHKSDGHTAEAIGFVALVGIAKARFIV